VEFIEKEKSYFFKYELGSFITSDFRSYEKISKKFKNYKFNEFYRFLLNRGDSFINTNKKVQSLDDAKQFVDMLEKGKIPSSIPYSDLPNIIKKIFEENGIGFPVPSFIIEAVFSEVNRDPIDKKPFRIKAGREKVDLGYEPVKLTDLARLNSVFGAVSFEDMNKSLKSSVVLSKSGKGQKINPLESVIKY
jgi:hypothetical protein